MIEKKVRIESELHYTELIMESEMAYAENYQITMIQENSIGNLLKVGMMGQDGGSSYNYDISGMKSLQKNREKHPWLKEEIERFLRQLLDTLLEMNNYMLDVNCLLLDPEYVFVKEDRYYFCYYPEELGHIGEAFHRLTEFMVKSIDYTHYPTVILVSGLHRGTMEEEYQLTNLIAQYTDEERVENPCESKAVPLTYQEEREQLQREDGLWKEDYSDENQGQKSKEVKHKEENEKGESYGMLEKMKDVLKETPVSRYWNQKQKEKWGSWEDLLTQEESSIIERT